MNWFDRLLRKDEEITLPPVAQQNTELAEERKLRQIERKRTDQLAELLADYRKQDRVLGRKFR